MPKDRTRSKPSGLPIIHPFAAGIDIGSRFHVVAVSPDLCDEPVQTFQAFTSDLQRMADWLVAYFGEAEHGFRLKPNENAGVPKRLFGLPKCLFGFPKPAFGKAKRIVSFRLAVLRMDQSVGIKVAPFGRY